MSMVGLVPFKLFDFLFLPSALSGDCFVVAHRRDVVVRVAWGGSSALSFPRALGRVAAFAKVRQELQRIVAAGSVTLLHFQRASVEQWSH
jgi:hypothetical protein